MADEPRVAIAVRRVRDGVPPIPLPTYQTPGAAGLDLIADVQVPVSISSGEFALVPTGLAFEIPPGFEAQVRPRSGLALKHGVTLLNSPGTIDSDYRGEVKVLMINHGQAPFVVQRGERIAQLVVSPIIQVDLVVVAELAESIRGDGGFGHTGRK